MFHQLQGAAGAIVKSSRIDGFPIGPVIMSVTPLSALQSMPQFMMESVKGDTAAGSELAPVIFEKKFSLLLAKKGRRWAPRPCQDHRTETISDTPAFEKNVAGYFLHSSTKARR